MKTIKALHILLSGLLPILPVWQSSAYGAQLNTFKITTVDSRLSNQAIAMGDSGNFAVASKSVEPATLFFIL
jgi:hypothetical protein